MKSREETERRILEGVDRIIRTEGLGALGINAVAREAGVNKVLLYRYFGSREELIRAWALERHYWKDTLSANTPGDNRSWRERGAALFEGQMDRLFEDSTLREIIRWHISSEDPLSREIMDRVERDGQRVMESFSRFLEPEGDTEALVALLIGGIYYLTLVSDRTAVFNGIPLDREEGRNRLKRGVSRMAELIFRDTKEKKA